MTVMITICLGVAIVAVGGGLLWQSANRRWRRDRARELARDVALEGMVFDVSAILMRCLEVEQVSDLVARALRTFWDFVRLDLYLRETPGWSDLSGRPARPPITEVRYLRLPTTAEPRLVLDVGSSLHHPAILIAEEARPQPVIAELSLAGRERILDILRGQIALALRRVLLYRHLERLARADPLTACWRRWYGRERLRELVETDEPLAVAILDIDDFKRVNDRFGHAVGDRVLRRLADLLKTNIRTEDLVSRDGGEEFVLILPRSAPDGAKRLAERLRAAVAAAELLPEGRLTVSIGLAWATPHDYHERLIQRADEALYAAKNSGRNRVSWLQADDTARTDSQA